MLGFLKVLLCAREMQGENNKLLRRQGLPQLLMVPLQDHNKLIEELAKIRTQVYAGRFGERLKGVVSVSMPVRTYYGEVLGSLSILWYKQSNVKKKYVI
ncbi:hypothetical protein E4K67_07610 [Desulfosporosinus fructosivorans]|uniref:IclR-ED domain-containing protein n=1 Tax=Desulfosporosinus fructosivorans TaxID=2018669 RepID=A0A4Z0RA07_9FIRM|nr:hypothetical protein E4K67_07610 [Desulfosporosinus fructosivorans]